MTSGINKLSAISEKTSNVYDYGCVMAWYDITGWDAKTNFIQPGDIYTSLDEPGMYGRELEPHVTLLYGLHDSELDLTSLVSYLERNKDITIKVKGLGMFQNDDYDVLKLDVDSDDLHRMNAHIKRTCEYTSEYTSEYPVYSPHITVAYLKQGCAPKYMDQIVTIDEVRLSCYKYTKANGTQIYIYPMRNIAV